MDPMVFTGGTGRFEEARGGGLTNSFVVFMSGSEHEFSGVIVLPKQRGGKHWNDHDDWDWGNNNDD